MDSDKGIKDLELNDERDSKPNQRDPIPFSAKLKLVRRVDFYKQCNKNETHESRTSCFSLDRIRTFPPKVILNKNSKKCKKRRNLFSNDERTQKTCRKFFTSPDAKILHIQMSQFVKKKLYSLRYKNGRFFSPVKLQNKVSHISSFNQKKRYFNLRNMKCLHPELDRTKCQS
ncbi:unnamed protein product [Moneuplotes crassus]|uniref:Uncharacterized protein n=1 Tax=Euplotes crassus TaxID=5936 RepID=A0AAD1Y3J3_EUPCR|nr:unnamed protein product [Moneuplotes crassus]